MNVVFLIILGILAGYLFARFIAESGLIILEILEGNEKESKEED